jgi:MarR family transcriptional regulator, 2-MHQ and catechol-resistance regulon repressor
MKAQTTNQDLALAAFVKLMRAAQSVSERSFRHLADSGLTPSQFAVMEALLHKGPLTQTELARKILRTGGNMTMVIDNLERDGMVRRERSSEDRRVVHVHLTKDGQVRIRHIFPKHAQQIEEQMAPLSASELKQLGSLCKRLGLGQTAA